MKYRYLLLLLFFATALSAQRADDFAEEIYKQSIKANEHHAIENVYLRTSKEVYELGEDLWFYTRILNSQTHVVSDLSEILYVELRYMDEQTPVHQEMYGLENGFVSGHLFLPDSLRAGEYRLSAFTANSAKYESDPITSSRQLLIRKKIVPDVLIQTSFDQAYYEDGESVAGQVRLLRPNGDAVVDTRTIISLVSSGKNEKRTRLRTDSTGRAAFNFEHDKPVASLQLKVRVSDEAEEETFVQQVPFDPNSRVQLQFLPEGGHMVAGLNSRIAFKSVDRSGMPLDIRKATLYANGEQVLDFSTTHGGMGSFNLFVDPNARYTVKVTEPLLDSTYILPEVRQEGARLFVQRETEEELWVGVTKTPDFDLTTAYLMVKQRGMLMWAASALVNDGGQLFKVPKVELVTGVAELMLYDQHKSPIASRLIFSKPNRQLNLSVEMDQTNYGVKEQASLKLKVTDRDGNPVQSAVALALNDELYGSPYAEENIMTHFLLNSELRGRIYEPSYYFEQPDETKSQHLDLLLMTQGWRAYEWNLHTLNQMDEKQAMPLLDMVMGQVIRKTLPSGLRKTPEVPVQLISGAGAVEQKTDSLGRFPIVASFLAMSEGSNIILKVPDTEQARMKFSTAFDASDQWLKSGRSKQALRKPVVVGKNWNKLPQAQAAAQEVQGVTIVDQKNSYGSYNGRDGHYVGNHSDYVCQYNILNCRNHRFGTRPIPGQIYRIGGRWVVYEAPEPEEYPNTFKGYYRSPKFYQPEYDKKPKEKLIPDFRNTLVWEPLIFTDEQGEATVKFFTSDIRSVFNGWVEGIGVNGHFGFVKFDVNVLK